MPLFPARNSPTLVQRLSDRRRGLALVGLAAAALLGARAARRKSATSESDYTVPDPSPLASAAPPVTPAAPPPAPVAPEPEPIAPAAVGPVEPEPPADPEPEANGEPEDIVELEVDSGEPAEPNTEELAAAEVAVLAILSQEGRLETDRTALGVATTLEREAAEVAVLLRTLHRQGHVAGDEYTATGEKIWFVTETGTGRLD